jgi:hypothetical protein
MSKRKSPADLFFDVSDEMKQWSWLLADEVASWPGVTRKRFFGNISLYRSDVIFASVPEKKALFAPNNVIFRILEVPPKLRAQIDADPKVNSSQQTSKNWFGYAVSSPQDLRGALEWFQIAYEQVVERRAAKLGKPRSR